MTKMHSIIGSLTYASINSHNLIQLSRRDDLESIGYMLIYLHLGRLKWQNIQIENNKNNDIIKQLKENIENDSSIPLIFKKYIATVRNIMFEETPCYEELIDLFKTELQELV
jgi:hypothetical protein